ncbi:FAD-dependent oxidoreductase [Streptomyces sp. NBC_00005]|uniref:FAD-dependent oxidoreductase n=1 Tax=Streptomyces sp. NBC_00005 TaxID=2903609 RepID=UPI0032496803
MSQSATVVVIGGGYGGASAAKALDEVADVALIEPRDAFFHAVGALRATVDPEFLPRVFFPYDRLLSRGRVIRDRAVAVEPGRVTLASGKALPADYIVLATGSSYPFPAKNEFHVASEAMEQYAYAQRQLAEAEQVMLLGAGPVGLEFAGEIKAKWPGKGVVIVDPASDILCEYEPELREEIRRQLADLDVRLILGSPLHDEPGTRSGELGRFQVTTGAGIDVTGDIWFRCYGGRPHTDYLVGALADVRHGGGRIAVTESLQVKGQETVFALGDITDLPESKRAGAAMRHAAVVARNITSLIEGDAPTAPYEVGPAAIMLPLGPNGGATQRPGEGIGGPEVTAQYKGADLLTGRFTQLFGLEAG